MQETLDAILNFLNSAWDVAYTIFDGLFKFFDLIGSLPSKIGNFLGFFPPEILAAILGLVAIVVVYKLVGRD